MDLSNPLFFSSLSIYDTHISTRGASIQQHRRATVEVFCCYTSAETDIADSEGSSDIRFLMSLPSPSRRCRLERVTTQRKESQKKNLVDLTVSQFYVLPYLQYAEVSLVAKFSLCFFVSFYCCVLYFSNP